MIYTNGTNKIAIFKERERERNLFNTRDDGARDTKADVY